MQRRSPLLSLYLLILIIVLSAVGLTFGNLELIKSNPGGEDFLAHWQATRKFLAEGTSPYPVLKPAEDLQSTPILPTPSDELSATPFTAGTESGPEVPLATPEASQPVETPGTQGNETTTENSATQDSNNRFLSPLYTMLVYIPLALIKSPDVARAIWMTFLELLLFYSGFMSIRWIRWKRPFLISFLLMVYAVFAYTSFSSILNGYLGLFSLACLVLVISAMLRGQDEIAGIAMALAMFRPETVYITVLLILVWCVRNHRQTVLYWFLGSFLLLVGFSALLIPDWVIQYFRTLVHIGANNPVGNTAASTGVFNGINLRLAVSRNVLLLILLVFEWFIVRTRNSLRLVWLTLLGMIVSVWIGGKLNIYSSVFIMPAILFSLSLFFARWKERSYPAMALILMVLFVLGWVFSSFFFSSVSALPVTISAGFILPLLSLLLLYWSRWWVLYSTSQNLD